ncbi:hypothetical protein Tco_0739166 [Tanacetum coccineum]
MEEEFLKQVEEKVTVELPYHKDRHLIHQYEWLERIVTKSSMDRDSNNNCYGNAEIRHGVKPTLSPNLNTLALVVVIHQSLQLCTNVVAGLLTAKVKSMKRLLKLRRKVSCYQRWFLLKVPMFTIGTPLSGYRILESDDIFRHYWTLSPGPVYVLVEKMLWVGKMDLV